MPNDTISADSKITYSFDFEVPNVQPLDVTPTTEEQIINAPAGVSGYSPVNNYIRNYYESQILFLKISVRG